MRILRAAWRDTNALWREFRRPILAFLIAMFGGGWLYGELLVAAGHPASLTSRSPISWAI